jgi:serine/threonine-protein kinase
METLINNRYQIIDTLGEGGMALVYKARDLMLERTIAIKVLRKTYSSSPAFQARFREEAKAAANLSHPNIVTIHDFGLDNERLYIIMEYVAGKNLKERIQETQGLPTAEATRLFIQACAGVGYAHRAGLVHCDIKPHNMLITHDNRLKVTDFGIARAFSSVNPDEVSDSVWGSPAYFSPEQAAGKAPSPASDVYSLGVVLFEMLTGRLPFTGSSSQEFAYQHRFEPPPSPQEFNPEISEALDTIILKVLSKEPATRYRTADQFGRILINFTQPRSGEEVLERYHLPDMPEAESALPEPSPAPPRIAWGNVFLALAALIAVGGLIPFWLWVYFQLNP